MWRLYPGGGGGGGGRRSLRVRASCDGRYQQGQQCRTTCGGDTIRGIVSYGTCEERKEEEGGEEGRGGGRELRRPARSSGRRGRLMGPQQWLPRTHL